MKIAIAADHGGYKLKEEIKPYIESLGHTVTDFGTYSEDSVDYPDYAAPCARAVVSGEMDRGIVICGTGIGISIAANKIKGVRCALCTDPVMARLTRERCDFLARIPITSAIESLNASVAAGIALYEVARCRGDLAE